VYYPPLKFLLSGSSDVIKASATLYPSFYGWKDYEMFSSSYLFTFSWFEWKI